MAYWRRTSEPYLGSFTYATLPAAASYSGYIARASDVGIAPGMLLVSDGTRWIPDGRQMLSRSAAAITCPADATEDILATVAIPAGLLGVNGQLFIKTQWTCTNGANDKTFRVRLGGIGGTAFLNTTQTTILDYIAQTAIANRNSASSQLGTLGSGLYGAGGSNFITGTIDTASAQDLVITGQKETSGESLILESYSVEVMP
jgi:hypothetical protein